MLFCPVCRLYLEQKEAEGATAHVCSSCGGTWISSEALLSSGKPVASIISALNIPSGAAQNPADVLTAWCPVCPATVLGADAAQPGHFRCPQCEGLWVLRGVVANPSTSPVAVKPVASPMPPAVDEQAPVSVTVNSPQPEPAALETVQPPVITTTDDSQLSPLERLLAGNQRFATGMPRGSAVPIVRLKEIGLSPQPWTLVVTCADCRVPPEVVFDQQLGEIVVIRTPGHVLDDTLLSGVEVMVERYNIPLVVIMGHTHCAAVEAAVDDDPHGYAMAMIDVIVPSVRRARLSAHGDIRDVTTRLHVGRMTDVIAKRQMVAKRLRLKSIQLVGLYYSVETGLVEQLEPVDMSTFEEAESQDISAVATPSPQSGAPQVSTQSTAADEPDSTGEFEGLLDAHQAMSDSPIVNVPVINMFDTSNDPGARWCPQCRQRLSPSVSACATCEVPAVTGDYSVECLSCRKSNPIRLNECRLCQAEMHPAWIIPSKSPSRLTRLFGR